MPLLSKSALTPSPSGMMCVAQAQVSQSVAIRMRRFSPFSVGNTRPVNVCMRTGTRANHAATIVTRPAFGVIECIMSGRSRRSTRHISHSDFMSFTSEMRRSIGTATVLMPSCSPKASSSDFPLLEATVVFGDEIATTSYPSSLNSLSNPEQNAHRDVGAVITLINFLMSNNLIL